jgi:protoporphyrinogen oxidase
VKTINTIILGGGLSGITLGRLLSAKGDEILVIEKDQTIGGLCRSRETDGFTFDIGGSHILFSRDQEVLSFIHSVLGENRGERDRNTKILYKGKYVKYPFENALYELPPEDRYTCLYEFIKVLIASEKGLVTPPANFHDWICQTFGKGIADAYLLPYNKKIWNYPPEKMSAHWMEGRVPRPPVEDIIKSAVGIETEGYTHQARFSYPVKGGIEALVQSMADPIKDKIRTGFTVKSIEERAGKFFISDGPETISAERVISTIPLQILMKCIPDLPSEVADAIRNLKYNSVVSIGIGVSGKVPPFSWAYIPDADISYANRISFPSNFSEYVTPNGCNSVLAEITYNEGDLIDRMNDDEIIAHIVSSLSKMGVTEPEKIKTMCAFRNQFAYVVYDLGYLKNISVVRDYFKNCGISLVGRFSQFEYLNMDGVIRSVMNFVKEC